MIINGQRFTPPRTPSSNLQRKPVPGSPTSGMDLSLVPDTDLNPEPADPETRQDYGLPAKSYADATEQPFEQQQKDSVIDEDSIKESPPRSKHQRQESEPRPYGEVMDQLDGGDRTGSPNGSRSPSLRHTRGRIEDRSSFENGSPELESFAQTVKELSPPATNGNAVVSSGIPPTNGMSGDKTPESYAKTVEEHPPATDGNAIVSGGVPPTNGMSGDKTPETFEGAGSDSSPRSPVRKAHKRLSSRSLNESANFSLPLKRESQPELQHKQRQEQDGVPEREGEPGGLVYENFENKSGENLASIKPFDDYHSSTEQREIKQATGEPPKDRPAQRQRQNSELVSGRRAGAGWQRSAIRWAPLNVPVQRRLQTLLVLLHTLSIAGGLALFFLLCTIPILWPLLLPYLIYVLLSRAGISGELGHRSEWLRRSKIWSLFASYFPARLHRSQPLEPNRKYIFGYHPHGIISHGAFAAFGTEALGFSQLFPGITNTLLTLDSNFRIPLYRDYALRMGLASVSRESCENILSRGGPNGEGMGRAITIVVGGARESLDAKPHTLRLVLKRRKGFVKLAIRCGADLVPVLSFGENDLYDQFDASAHPWVHKGQLIVKKFMGFTVRYRHRLRIQSITLTISF